MRRARRLFGIFLALSMLLTTGCSAAAADGDYTDVPSDAAYAEAAAYLKERGIMTGTSATEFSPDKRIKAVATLSMFNTGRVRRNGFMDGDTANVQTRLQKAAEARNKELKGEVT